MSQKAIRKFEQAGVTGQGYFLPADKLVSGNPQQHVWNHYSDASQKFFAGYWQSEVGKWRIAYTEEEYCQILEGVSTSRTPKGLP